MAHLALQFQWRLDLGFRAQAFCHQVSGLWSAGLRRRESAKTGVCYGLACSRYARQNAKIFI